MTVITLTKGYFTICKLIFDNVEVKNPATNTGRTPLSMAAENGHYKIFKLFFHNVEDKNPVEMNGSTPLHFAAHNGHFRISKLIIENVDNMNPANIFGLLLLTMLKLLKHAIKAIMILAN